MCSCLGMPSCVTKTIRWMSLEKDNKGWTKAERTNRWVIIPSLSFVPMENYSAELNCRMKRDLDSFMQLKLRDSFFYLLLGTERDGEMIFLFIIVENVCRIKRDPLNFGAINSVMLKSDAPFSQMPLSWIRIFMGHLSTPSMSSQGL